jgi:hypothetical protein
MQQVVLVYYVVLCMYLEKCGVEARALIRKWGRAHVATRTIPCNKQCRIEGKQSMNYLQYAFYAINIYL